MSGKLPTSVLHRPRAFLFSSSSSSPCTQTLASLPTRISRNHNQNVLAGHSQVRHATFVPRPRRPYQFTQLVQLSDGSTFTVRTTMPQGMLKSTKDSRNHTIWQPSNKSLKNVEVDEAGKLAAFRERFGRGWDLDAAAKKSATAGGNDTAAAAAAPAGGAEGEKKKPVEAVKTTQKEEKKTAAAAAKPEVVEEADEEEDPFDSLTDLISSYAKPDQNVKGGLTAKEQDKKDKKK